MADQIINKPYKMLEVYDVPTMPENLPTTESNKKVESRVRKSGKRLG